MCRISKLTIFLSATLLVLITAMNLALAAKPGSITIGTGGVTGVYYPVSGALCQLGSISHNTLNSSAAGYGTPRPWSR